MDKLYKYPRLTIILILALTIFFALQIPNIIIDNDLYKFVGEDNPVNIENSEVEDIFKTGENMVVALESRYSRIISPENIQLIDTLTRQFEKIRNVEKVTSLTNADYIEPTGDGMKVSSLIPGDMYYADESQIIQRLRSWEVLYRDNLFTPDYKSTQILLTLVNDLELDTMETIFGQVKAITDQVNRDDINIYIAGIPAILVTIKGKIYDDFITLVPIVILIVIVMLYFSFHSMAGVFLPLLNVLISTIWAIGLMALLKEPFTMIGTGIPVILISVGSAYGIHLLSHTYDEMAKGYTDFKAVLMNVVKKIRPAILLAGLTTMAGFGSLITSSIVPMRNMGLFLAYGVAVALFVALTLTPSILILRQKPLKKANVEKADGGNSLMNRFLIAFYELLTKRSLRNIAFATIVLILSVIGTTKILVDTNMIDNFEDSTPISRADAFVNENFGGSTLLTVVVDGKEDGSLLNPEILKAMDDMADYLENSVELVGKVTSFTEFVKRMNQVMNAPSAPADIAASTDTDLGGSENSGSGFDDEFDTDEESSFSFEEFGDESSFSFEDSGGDFSKAPSPSKSPPVTFPSLSDDNLLEIMEDALAQSGNADISAAELIDAMKRVTNEAGMAYYEIPYDPAKYPATTREELKNLVAQYLLLYSGNLSELINDPLEPGMSRMIVQIKSPMNADAIRIDRLITDYARENFPDGYEVRVVGSGKILASLNKMVLSSQFSSIISALMIVFFIIAFYFKSIVAGLLGIANLIFSIMINFGVMGFFGIKLDMGSSIVASVAIGIGIDYTIHFLTRYREESRLSSDKDIITKNTLLSSGKAIIFNALAVAAGFAVLMKSNFVPIKSLGLLVCLTMITSAFSALTVLPSIIHLFNPKFLYDKR